MKRIYYVFYLLLCCYLPAHAQQFINGSIEPKGTITPCTAGPIATVNANLGNGWITGMAAKVLLNDGSCASGAAAAGSHYAGLSYTFSMTTQEDNILVLKLDAPLKVDTVYKITYSYKLDTSSTYKKTANLFFGYTHDSTGNDTSCGSRSNLTSTTWKVDTLTIKPKVSMQYIWVEPQYFGGIGSVLVYFDDFKVLTSSTPPQSIPAVNAEATVRIYPNPFHGSTNVELGTAIKLPCRLNITDITGKSVMQKTIKERNITIERNDLANGMYFMQVTDKSQHNTLHKLLIE